MPTPRKDSAEAKLYEIVEALDIAMLTTLDGRGNLHTRPMANQEADENGDIWFFTDKDGSVAKNVKANPRLSLGYSNASSRYAAIVGKGEMVSDPGMIAEKWSEDMKAWFPKGKSDPNLVLLKVTPDKGEYWDAGQSTIISAIGYFKAKITGEKADDLMDNRKVSL